MAIKRNKASLVDKKMEASERIEVGPRTDKASEFIVTKGLRRVKEEKSIFISFTSK